LFNLEKGGFCMMTPKMIARMKARFFQYALNSTIVGIGSDLPQKQIQNGFHFWSEFLTITYPTISDAGLDDGVNRFTAQFKSGANQIGLSNDLIDLSTIAVPGRQRSPLLAGDPNQTLNIQGFPWPYLYEATGSIIVDLRKSGTSTQTIRFVWTGFLIPVSVVPTAENFYDMLASEYPDFGVSQIQA
jgi:hypothetical protein